MNQSPYDNLDYLLFGEQIAGASGTTHKFTGKERDSESGLDNFDARYSSSSTGRFCRPIRRPVIRKTRRRLTDTRMSATIRSIALTRQDWIGISGAPLPIILDALS